MLRTIVSRSREQMGIALTVDDSAKELLIEKGYDEKYGARRCAAPSRPIWRISWRRPSWKAP